MPTRSDQQLSDDYGKLSTGKKVASNVLDAIGLLANSGSLGLGGGAVDLVHGDPWGTAAHEARFRLNNSGPIPVGTAADLVGSLVGGGAAVKGVKALPGAVKAIATAGPTIGTRAAALGATSPSYLSTAAKFLGIPAAVFGTAAYLNADGSPAAAAPAITPKDAVVSALAQGKAAPADPQHDLATAVSQILGGKHTISDVQAVGPLVPAAIKPGGSAKDAIYASAYSQSKALADSAVSELQAQAAAGTITAAQRDAGITKALKSHFDQTAGLVGYDPSKVPLINPDTAE